jgi:Arc/MetJ family transcription regulator
MYDDGTSSPPEGAMQIQVNIDDELMRKALAASDVPTPQAVIEEALRMLICLSSTTELEDMFGMFPNGIDHPDRD